MSEDAISEMYNHDLTEFNSNRRYNEHNQQMPLQKFDDEDDIIDKSPLNERFLERVSETIEQSTEKSRYWWIEEIENPKLVQRLRKLSAEDVELLS